MRTNKNCFSPTEEDIKKQSKIIKEVDITSVITMHSILGSFNEIQNKVFDALETKHNLSHAKLFLMIYLHSENKSVAPSILANKMGVSKANISGLLSRMERDKLLKISDDKNDGRGKSVKLSVAGKKLMKEFLPLYYTQINKIMKPLAKGEQRELVRLLSKIKGEKK